MKIEIRKRWTVVNGLRLAHHDLVLLPESEHESQVIDLLGGPDSFIQGQIRLADGYGEHYVLLQPRLTISGDHPDDCREFPESPDLEVRLRHRITVVPNPQRAANPGPRETNQPPMKEGPKQ